MSAAAFGMGIYRVQLAGLDTTTNGSADGYRNYSCMRRPNLLQGSTYTLRVQTGASAAENVVAWLDYNNDGTFASTERILYSLNALTHTVNFTVPATATMNQPLRLRIAADYANSPIPTACSTPQYSQTEDYQVSIAAASVAPVAAFAAADTVTCSGTVAFRDASLNSPATWRWQFGDGATSTQQHPTHTYAAAGRYAVRLRVCNAAGCDSLTRLAYVRVRTDGPRAATCQPATAAYCCQFGLTRVRLGSIDRTSADGQAGYEDFSCTSRATLTADRPYSLQLTTGPNAHDVRVYLDLNDDGQFTAPAELIYQGLAVQSPTTTLTIASTLAPVYNRALRLRIVADYAGSPATGPCSVVQSGQAEDYSIMLVPNTARPTAAFTVQYQQLCGPVRVALTNATTGGATSYTWNFGDGSSSTAANPPVHTYSLPGAYEVRLVAQNAFGSDTVRQRIAVATNCPSYCTGVAAGGTTDAKAYFTRLQFANLDNTDLRGPGVGYLDYTARIATVQAGQTYPFRAESLPWQFSSNGPWNAVEVWIDYNQDGQFGAQERIGPLTQFSPHQLSIRIPLSAKAGATRMRAIIHQFNNYVYEGGCVPGNLRGETEDYTLLILPPTVPPRTGFLADLPAACNGLVQFRDTSWVAPSEWQWNFGDGGTSTLQHPQHQYAAMGTYTVSLQARNAYGAQLVTRTNYVTVSALAAGPRPAACLPTPLLGIPIAGHGIDTLKIGTSFSYNQPLNSPGFRDETCTRAALAWTQGASYPVRFADYNGVGASCFIWLDANDDGVFDETTELVFNSLLAQHLIRSLFGTLRVPATALTGRPLRLRVSSWPPDDRVPFTSPPSACSREVASGQVRDFTVIVRGALATARTTAAPNQWQVAPNPITNGQGIIYGHFSKPVAVELRDVLGRVVYQTIVSPDAQGNLRLNVGTAPKGIYLLRVGSSSQSARLSVE